MLLTEAQINKVYWENNCIKYFFNKMITEKSEEFLKVNNTLKESYPRIYSLLVLSENKKIKVLKEDLEADDSTHIEFSRFEEQVKSFLNKYEPKKIKNNLKLMFAGIDAGFILSAIGGAILLGLGIYVTSYVFPLSLLGSVIKTILTLIYLSIIYINHRDIKKMPELERRMNKLATFKADLNSMKAQSKNIHMVERIDSLIVRIDNSLDRYKRHIKRAYFQSNSEN